MGGGQIHAHQAAASVVLQSASKRLGFSQLLQALTYVVELDQHSKHLQTQIEALFEVGAGFGEDLEDVEGLLEPVARVLECRSLNRLGPCLPEIADRLFSEFASKGVIGEPFDLWVEVIGMERLDGGDDPPMKLTPTIAQEPTIGDFVGERVLETVFDVGVEPRLLH